MAKTFSFVLLNLQLEIATELDKISAKLENVDEMISSADAEMKSLLSGTADVWMLLMKGVILHHQLMMSHQRKLRKFSGCKFPCSCIPVYSCHACNFFLHDQCFNAPRSLIHPLHPDHPLSLFPFPTYTYGSFLCNSCT